MSCTSKQDSWRWSYWARRKTLFHLEGWTEAIVLILETIRAFTFNFQPFTQCTKHGRKHKINNEMNWIVKLIPRISEWNRSAQPLSTCIHLEKICLHLLTNKGRNQGQIFFSKKVAEILAITFNTYKGVFTMSQTLSWALPMDYPI